MDLTELERARPVLAYSPHPLLLAKERELVYAAFLPNETILEYLRRVGLLERMARQPFALTVDGRRLPRTLWAHCRPKPGTLINLYAQVHGGGDGKKNPIATIAMIALTVYAPGIASGIGGAAGVTSAAALSAIQVGVMVVGGMVINSIFPPPRPDLARAQNLGGGDSPTYAIQGGSNRMRRYEPMPKIIGVHRVFPDFGAQPYSEFEGNDQVGYYVFDLGYNDAELTDFKIGDTPIEDFEGIEMEISGADGKLALFPGNVDSTAGVELPTALGFVSRTSSPAARSLAVELTGALFFLADEGTDVRAATVDIEYRAVGAPSWTALQFAPDTAPAIAIVEGVARVPATQYAHGVRREITVQPVEDIGLTVLSASANTPAGVGTLTYGFNKAIQSGAWRWTPPGGPIGEFVRVREGGQFVLFDATRTMSLLINVTNHYPIETIGNAGAQHEFTIGASAIDGQFMLMNASREPLRRTFKWHVPEGQYEVQVKKSTPEEVSQRAVAQIVWSQLRTYQPDEADFTGRLRVGMKVRANALANGVLQQMSCIARARCRVWGEFEDFDVVASGDAHSGGADNIVLADNAEDVDVADGRSLRLAFGAGSVQERHISAVARRAAHFSLPGTAGNYASTPDSASVSVTGDIDIRTKLSLDDWSPATRQGIARHWLGSDPNRAWDLSVTTSPAGVLVFVSTADGTTQRVASSTMPVGFVDGSTHWIRVTRAASSGDVKFYTRDGDNDPWVQLGATVSTTAGAIADVSQPLIVGMSGSGGNFQMIGKMHYLELRNGIDGSVVACFDPRDAFPGAGTVTSSKSQEVWTVSTNGSPAAALDGEGPQQATVPVWSMNLVKWSEDCDTAPWGTNGANPITPGDTPPAPYTKSWTQTSNGTSVSRSQAAIPTAPATAYRCAVVAKKGTSARSGLSFYNGASHQALVDFNWSAGGVPSLHAVTSGSANDITFENLGDGFYKISFEVNSDADGGNHALIFYMDRVAGTGSAHFTGFEVKLNAVKDAPYFKTETATFTLPNDTTDYELLDEWPIRHNSIPGWWYIDALRGKTINGRRVYGGGMPDTRIDIEGLKAFAQWCVDQGLEFNGVFDQQQSLFDILSAIALMGRATPTMQTGKHGVLWDAPDLPVTAHFGMHNIMPGTFEVDYATGDLADVIEYWFINPDLGWQRDFVRALVPGAQSQARVRRIEGFGCISKAQAIQNANLYAAANTYRARRYKWRSDWEQMPSPRGDVVELWHDLLQMLSGRLVEGGDASTLKLPRPVPLYATGGVVTLVKPNGEFDTYAVDGGVGETDTLTLPSPLPFNPWADASHPPYDYRWHYGPTADTGRKVKIESFKPVSERYVDVTAVDEDPAYYAAKDLPAAPIPNPSVFGQVQLLALEVTEDGVRAGSGYLARVLMSWDLMGDYGFADVRASVNGGPMELVAAGVRGRSYAFNVQDFTNVTIEVTAWSSFGRHGKSSKLSREHFVNYAGQSPPGDPRNFLLDGMTFRWSRGADVDIVGSRIRFHFGENTSFSDAHALHDGLLASSPATFQTLPFGVVTFFCTEVDAAGLESTTPAVIVKDLGDPVLANVVEEMDFRAESWPGSVTNGSDVGGDLEADSGTDFYGADDGPFYGDDAGPFYEDDVFEEMVYVTEIFYFPTEWIGSVLTLEHEVEGASVTIEYRTTNGEDFYGEDGEDFYGPDAEAFYGDDGEWLAWPGALTYQGGDVQLSVTTAGGPMQGAIRGLRAVIDVPDIVEDIQDVAVPPGGIRLTLTKDFDVIKTLQLTLQNDGGDAVSARYLDKDAALGPLVECIDETQASVAGILDATITGR